MFGYKKIFKYVWPLARKYKFSIILLFLGYTVGIILDNLLKPYLYKEIIDTLSSDVSKELILGDVTRVAIYIALVIFVYNIFYRIGDYAVSYFESRMIKDLYDFSFRRLMQHSYGFFTNNFSGGLVAKSKRFTRAFELMTDVISFQIWFSFVNLVGVFIVLFWQVPVLGYVFLFWSVLYIFITILFLRKKMALDILEAEADSKVTGRLADAITNILNIKIFVRSLAEINDFSKVTQDEETKRIRSWNFANLQNTVQALLMAVLQILVLFVSINMWSKGNLSVGTLVLLQTYMFNIFNILWHLGKSLTRFVKSLADMKEMIDILETKPEIVDPNNPLESKIQAGHIVFQDVHFRYSLGEEVLSGFNLEIKPGERVGIVGHSGAGKSTITRLLLRFNDVTAGKLMIDGQDVKEIKQDDLRKKISYVPQESILFHRPIRENIAYGKTDASQSEISTAAQKAHADEFIQNLSSGYETLVGERGVKLSGGERQRVAIARAMLKDAPILMLDEATSSLDSISETYIQESFDELMKGKTTIVIAHRLSTIQKMDRIIVLDKGKIVEEGSHDELLKKKGIYADLWEHQTGGFLE